MSSTRTLVPVEDIDISKEQVNPDTWMKIYPYDGSGQYSPDGKQRLIVWIAEDDDDEYPRQSDSWYPVGTLVPLEAY